MTNEEKQLLLKDLCGMLPYGVKCNVPFNNNVKRLIRVECDVVGGILLLFDRDAEEDLPCECYLSEMKPYLRPMSSMTEEEKKELKYEFGIEDIDDDLIDFGELPSKNSVFCLPKLLSLTDWLNKKMFDYRGLIPKGLALPATEDMYQQLKI